MTKRPRLSDELVEKIEKQADAILADSPTSADDISSFERRLEIVFEAARAASQQAGDPSRPSGPASPQTAVDDLLEDVAAGEHPGGDAAAEAMIVDFD